MLVNLYQFGRRKVGYTKKILADGSSGIADIIWEDEYRKKMKDRSKDGKQWLDILHKSGRIAGLMIILATRSKDKLFYIGHMIVASIDYTFIAATIPVVQQICKLKPPEGRSMLSMSPIKKRFG